MNTGRLKWYLGRESADAALPALLTEEEADKSTDAFRLCLDAVFLGPPTPINGKLYVLIEQAGCVRLLPARTAEATHRRAGCSPP